MVNIYSPSRCFRDHTNTAVYKDGHSYTGTRTHMNAVLAPYLAYLPITRTNNVNIRSRTLEKVRGIFVCMRGIQGQNEKSVLPYEIYGDSN